MKKINKIIKLAAMILKEQDSLYFRYDQVEKIQSVIINDDRVKKYIKTLFNNFLTKKDAKHKFYNNVPSTRNIEDYLNLPQNLISIGFLWASTYEGHTYWNKLHTEWVNLTYKNIYDPLMEYLINHQSK